MLSKFHCPTCGSEIVYRSRPRSFTERFLMPFALLRPVRCGECYRRTYATVFTGAKKRGDTHGLRRAA
jgi:hypothetical protein